MLQRKLSIIILAAGKGTRMHSSIPKVLHKLAGKTMLQRVLETAFRLNAHRIHIVYSEKKSLLKNCISNKDVSINWIFQKKSMGTGHAVKQVLPDLHKNEDILILYGDIPLISYKTLKKLISSKKRRGISILTAIHDNPDGYGRILRNKSRKIFKIIEHEDANFQQKRIKEINTGILVICSDDLKIWIKNLTKKNIKHEFYLTDIIHFAWIENRIITAVQTKRLIEIEGVNNHLQLSRLEKLYQKEQAEKLLLSGVKIVDPERFDLRGYIKCGKDVLIDTNVIIEGKAIIGNRVKIGTGCFLKNVYVGNDVTIGPYTIIEDSKLCSKSKVGPFSRIRPGSTIKDSAHIGNFVEIKNVNIGKDSKVGHLSYLGDAHIGSKVNIGAGTITCNYDGNNKHKTIINNNVFVGSDSQLIAPIIIDSGAKIGAGTTVTKNVKSGETVISRIRQFPIKNKSKLEIHSE